MRTDLNEKKETILKWISENKPKVFICKELKCKYTTLNSWLIKNEILYDGNQGGKGKKSNKRLGAIEYSKSTFVHSHRLKLKLIEDGIKEHKCEKCNKRLWLKQPIPLELHHKDGDHFNNEISNLMILCCNCHGIEPNNSGKAIGKYS